MIKVEVKGLKELQKGLEKFARQALPHAARTACNRAAFEARDVWGKRIQAEMTTRNTFTARSLRVEKARGVDISSMQSKVGSLAPYMGKREAGSIETPRSGKGLPIPSPVAAGQPPGAKRTKLVRPSNKMARIALAPRPGRNRKQRNLLAVKSAAKGTKFAFLELDGGRRVIAKVSGRGKRIRVQTVWDLSRRSVRVRPIPTLQQTLDTIGPRLPGIYVDALVEQCKRHRILGY